MKNYIIQGADEINKLKQNLMTDQGKTITTSSTKETANNENNDNDNKKLRKIAAEEIRRIMNERIGNIFEENIRGCLECEFEFQKSPIERNVEVREIKIKNREGSQFVEKNKSLEIELNGKLISFVLNKDFSVSIVDKETGKEIQKIEDDEIETKVLEVGVVIFKNTEMEIDGIYNLKRSFDKNVFDKNEVKIIYENIDEDKKYDMAVTESKLNTNRIGDLIRQIKRNNIFFKKISEKNVIHLGFINGTNVNSNIDLKQKLKDIECIIFGLKNCKLCGRNMERCIDWVTASNVKKIMKDMKKIKKDMKKIKKDIKKNMENITKNMENISKNLENITKCLNNLNEKVNKMESDFLGKKTKRPIEIEEKANNNISGQDDTSNSKIVDNKSIKFVKIFRRKDKKNKIVKLNIK